MYSKKTNFRSHRVHLYEIHIKFPTIGKCLSKPECRVSFILNMYKIFVCIYPNTSSNSKGWSPYFSLYMYKAQSFHKTTREQKWKSKIRAKKENFLYMYGTWWYFVTDTQTHGYLMYTNTGCSGFYYYYFLFFFVNFGHFLVFRTVRYKFWLSNSQIM